jgi:hypothetical protein
MKHPSHMVEKEIAVNPEDARLTRLGLHVIRLQRRIIGGFRPVHFVFISIHLHQILKISSKSSGVEKNLRVTLRTVNATYGSAAT